MSTFLEYDKNINRQVKVFKINFKELIILGIGLGGLILLGGVISTIGLSTSYYYLFILLLLIVAIIFLKRANKKDHPSYLLSFLSYKVFQPKKMKILSVRIHLNKKR